MSDSENLYYLLHLVTSEEIRKKVLNILNQGKSIQKIYWKIHAWWLEMELKNSEKIEGERNANDNLAVVLENMLKGHFVN